MSTTCVDTPRKRRYYYALGPGANDTPDKLETSSPISPGLPAQEVPPPPPPNLCIESTSPGDRTPIPPGLSVQEVPSPPPSLCIESISPGDLDPWRNEDEPAEASDCRYVASYNWLDGENQRDPTILVPGKAPWSSGRPFPFSHVDFCSMPFFVSLSSASVKVASDWGLFSSEQLPVITLTTKPTTGADPPSRIQLSTSPIIRN